MVSSTQKRRKMASKDDRMARRATIFVAEQIHFANTLAGNDPNKRARAMKKLRQYLLARSKRGTSFTEEDFLRIWKGLFYCMWMSDKPLVQEDLAEEISSLVHVFSQADKAFLFVKGFFSTMMNEWYGIDAHRLEKFCMFVRRFLRQTLYFCKKKDWNSNVVVAFANTLKSTILSVEENEKEKVDVSLVLHFVEIFLEELAKAGEGELLDETLLEILKPFASNLTNKVDERIQNEIRSKIFYGLINQTPAAAEYEEKMKAWRRAGFPGSSWKDMVFEEEGVKPSDRKSKVLLKNLDPRAGGAHVFLPNISFDPKKVAEMLETFVNEHNNNALIKKVITSFQKLAEGEYPFAKHIPKSWLNTKKLRISKKLVTSAAENLVQFKSQIKSSSIPQDFKTTVRGKPNNKSKKRKEVQESTFKNKENLPHVDIKDHDCKEVKESPVVKKKLKRKENPEVKKKSEVKENNGLKEVLSPKKKKSRKEKLALKKEKRRNAAALKASPAEQIKQIDGEVSSNEIKTQEQANGEAFEANGEAQVRSSEGGDFKEFYLFQGLFSNNKKENAEEMSSPREKKKRVVLSAKRRLKNGAPPKESHEENTWNLTNSHDSSVLTSDSVMEISDQSENATKIISVWEENKSCDNTKEDIPEQMKVIEPSPATNKRVNIVLQKNKAQAMSEYLESVKLSPSVPHDGSKKPFKGVLKRSSIQSPINPFYRSPQTGGKKQKKCNLTTNIPIF